MILYDISDWATFDLIELRWKLFSFCIGDLKIQKKLFDDLILREKPVKLRTLNKSN